MNLNDFFKRLPSTGSMGTPGGDERSKESLFGVDLHGKKVRFQPTSTSAYAKPQCEPVASLPELAQRSGPCGQGMVSSDALLQSFHSIAYI
jgi:hypothetical protein